MHAAYDIIIIGTGSGGGTIAQRLDPSGKKILILERGDLIPKEKENRDVNEVVVKSRYRPDETWYDKDNQPFKPFTHYVVGGNSKMYAKRRTLVRRRSGWLPTNRTIFTAPAFSWMAA